MDKKLVICISVILTLIGCKQPYIPILSNDNANILVVEGLINTGPDSTIIKLSRTVIVANKQTLNPEADAALTIEGEANETYTLKETKKGLYVTAPLNLSATKKYRLRIKTASGSTYLSDFVETRIAPPIGKVSWKINNNKVELFVSTEDPNNKTKYYRWEYEESWIFYAKFASTQIWNKDSLKVQYRDLPKEEVSKCWGNDVSSTIYLGSSAKLTKDVIFEAPLNTIQSTSEKLTERYSILVKQYSLTKEAYSFWESLKKNTETLGSIFDAQPSELVGNIHNVNNASEPVIGYISACAVQKQRIYIDRAELPRLASWVTQYPFDCIAPDTVSLANLSKKFHGFEKQYIPIEPLSNAGGFLIGYTASTTDCADCTIRGSNKKPLFWQ